MKKQALSLRRSARGISKGYTEGRYFFLSVSSVFLCSFILLLSSHTNDDGTNYLEKVSENFSQIKDYSVDVRVHFDLESVKSPDMSAKIYYKTPDKVKIDSKGTFLLPKEVGVFNPRIFNADNFNVNVEGNLEYDGHPAVRLSLSPKKESFRNHDIILTVDKSDWLIKEISIEPARGSMMDAKIKYGRAGGFELPSEIDVNLNLPPADTSRANPGFRRDFRNGLTGSVEIYYSNYNVNSGLSDSLFVKEVER